MTVVSLYDVIARAAPPVPQAAADERLMLLAKFASRMIAESLAGLAALREIEEQFVLTPRDDAREELNVRRSVWTLYSDWMKEAETVLERARSLRASGAQVTEIGPLDLEIGKVQARLKVKPEATARAIQDARQGRVIPAKELRDELRARLRA